VDQHDHKKTENPDFQPKHYHFQMGSTRSFYFRLRNTLSQHAGPAVAWGYGLQAKPLFWGVSIIAIFHPNACSAKRCKNAATHSTQPHEAAIENCPSPELSLFSALLIICVIASKTLCYSVLFPWFYDFTHSFYWDYNIKLVYGSWKPIYEYFLLKNYLPLIARSLIDHKVFSYYIYRVIISIA